MKMLSDLANEIVNAYTREAIPPLRHKADDTSVEVAYQIQDINTELWLEQGRKLIGRKIGLTSKAVQEQLGVDQPDYGMIWADSHIESNGTTSMSHYLQPKVEAEIAFVLNTDLSHKDISMSDLIHAIDYASPALEIVDSRIADWDITLFDTIADNASYGAIVMGEQQTALDEIDLVECKMQLTENGQVVSEGNGAACMGNPLNASLWLANIMVDNGRALQAGDIILSGALGAMVNAKNNSNYTASIEGLGEVVVNFGD